jgi:hypothetical protein
MLRGWVAALAQPGSLNQGVRGVEAKRSLRDEPDDFCGPSRID